MSATKTHARARYSSAARSRLSTHRDDLCQALSWSAHQGVLTRPCSVSIALITANGPKNPTAEEWAAFAASRNLGYMGTHLRALLTGEQCPKGLICLGCAHAQPKKSAGPIFRRMLASHERSLVAARSHSEPADRSRPAPYFVNALQAGSFGIWVHFRKVRRATYLLPIREGLPVTPEEPQERPMDSRSPHGPRQAGFELVRSLQDTGGIANS